MVLKKFNTNNAWFTIAGMGGFLIKKQTDMRCRAQFIAPPVIPNSAKILKQISNDKAGFSLVEMLMALLVASLLLAALAPVMTKRMNENMHITGSFSQNTRSEIREIKFGDPDFCNKIVRDSNNNPLYCEGEYVVPQGFKNITVTAIGGGGGGGTAPTAGYTEFTTAGSTNNFIVPAMVNQLEATLIGGGAPGGAGGQIKKTQEFTTVGSNTFNIPAALKNKAGSVTMCGAGGRGGQPFNNVCWGSGTDAGPQGPGGGGSGGFYKDKVVTFPNSASVSIYVGGAGAGYTWYGVNPDQFFTDQVIYPERNGVTAEDGSGGAGGITKNRFVQNGNGGNGGHSAGGTGGLMYGWCGHVGAGGGGGGASRLCANGQSCYLYVGGGGGGGGAGIWNTSMTPHAVLSGGAGGGGGGTGLGGRGGEANERNRGCVSGGGGGGLPGGNAGGSSKACDSTIGGDGGASPLSGYPNNCRGGDLNTEPANGIVSITYLDYGPGASGGGAAHIVPLQKILVTPAETLGITVGKGLEGSKAGKINSDGTVKEPEILTTWDDKTSTITKITRGAASVLFTPGHNPGKGLSGGSYTGEVLGVTIGPFYAGHGWMTNGIEPFSTSYASGYNGFYMTNGRTAGNTDFVGNKTYAAETSGGDGGKVTTPWFECTPGKGARTAQNSDYTGGNASGYGCGGGGGYGLSNGGNGSGGYARVSWNMYWDAALNSGKGAYKYAEIGAGGGGASGNVVTETIRVTEGQVIKVKIGAGGAGAKVANNEIVPANPGGTTIFGDTNFIEIKAGGGGGGESPLISGNTLINGKGGEISRVCDVGSRKYLDNKNHCTKGKPGGNANDNENKALGGRGADFSYDKYAGSGGMGGIQDTGENSSGKNADNTGVSAGGGGAAIRLFNSAVSLSNVLNNPNKGGDGAPGMIILKLWE